MVSSLSVSGRTVRRLRADWLCHVVLKVKRRRGAFNRNASGDNETGYTILALLILKHFHKT
jgi:hypothetical protein